MLRIFKIQTILFLIGGSILFSSCSDQLDIKPESSVSPDQISATNIRYFLNGLYRQSFGSRDDYFVNDIRGGNYTWTALSGNNSAYGTLITGTSVDDRLAFSSRIWNNSYKNIYNANSIIQAADQLGDDATVKLVKAETSYVRAYLYYQLVTAFGDVPLVITNTTENIPRTPAAEVWKQIITDLDFAIANGKALSATSFRSASIEAAKALKARALLASGDKAGAAQLAKELIDQSGRTIDDNYGNIFRSTASSKEVIFAFENLKSELNLRLSQLFWPYGTTWAGSYFVQPSDYVLNQLYAANDLRKDVNIQKITNSDGTFNMIVSKYWDVQPLIVSRISEMYLICAEGLPESQGLGYLNQLRTKRGLPVLTAGEAGTGEAYLDVVLEERRRELFSEGFLFHDLARTDRAINLPNIQNKDQYLLPLPGSQVDLSNGVLEQNKGY